MARLLTTIFALALLTSCDSPATTTAPSGNAVSVTPAPTGTTSPPKPSASLEPRFQARVVKVVDGDTIDVELDRRTYRIRYIGINTPESVDPRRPVEKFGKEAAAKNTELVAGKTVWLEKDVSETDQYGRILRYVYVGNMFVNAELVRLGYARAVTYPPDVKYQDLFRRLEREAREAKKGLWAD